MDSQESEDPWQITRLIGWQWKCSNALSLPVLMVKSNDYTVYLFSSLLKSIALLKNYFVLKLRSPERRGTTSSHSEQSRETRQR